MFFKRLVGLKKVKVEFKVILKTKDEVISVGYDCNRFIDSHRFLSCSLDNLFKNLDVDDFVIFRKRVSWQMAISQ